MVLLDFWTFTGLDFSDPGPFLGSVISLIWNIIKMVFVGAGMAIFYVVGGIAYGIYYFFKWIFSWEWEEIGEFILDVIKFPFQVIGRIFEVAFDILKAIFSGLIKALKWFFEVFADVIVWFIKLQIFILSLRFITDPSSIPSLFGVKKKEETKEEK